jgi:L-2-hydroxyglutarate oxidase LhgO
VLYYFPGMDQANILIVGGGVVGCAIACAVSKRWQDVFLVEQFPKLGMVTSTRNSGVIHAGIYYPKNSLKARHCLEGNRLTYEFCAEHKVPHRRTGKLVVATSPPEEEALWALKKRGEDNGVGGMRLLGPEEIRKREPHVSGVSALEVPATGILSSEDLVRTYARVAAEQGAHIVNHSRVVSLEAVGEAIRAGVRIGDMAHADQDDGQHDMQRKDAERGARHHDPGQYETIEARCVINAAGLFADEVAALLGNHSWTIYPVRGEYCEIRGSRSSLINGLVYPLPHADGLSLGVHLTKTLSGTLLVGPTATYVEEKNNYERGRLAVADFAKSAKALLPEIEECDLQLAYSGLRPKLVPPREHHVVDFVITRDALVPQAIHLVGIESPGLTAAPSIAEHVFQLAAEILE